MLSHDWFPKPVPQNATLGHATWLYSSFAFLHFDGARAEALRVGHDSGLYNGTFFNLGPDATVEIGNFTTVVGCIFATNGRIEVGSYVFISHEVVMADSAYARIAVGEQAERASEPVIRVRDGAWIGFRAVLLKGADIGEGAIVGAAAVVNFTVPDYAIVAGSPARVVGWTSRSG